MKRILARVDLEIVKRLGHAERLRRAAQALDRRTHPRRLAAAAECEDWECLNRKALAFLRLASIRLMLRKLCNPA